MVGATPKGHFRIDRRCVRADARRAFRHALPPGLSVHGACPKPRFIAETPLRLPLFRPLGNGRSPRDLFERLAARALQLAAVSEVHRADSWPLAPQPRERATLSMAVHRFRRQPAAASTSWELPAWWRYRPGLANCSPAGMGQHGRLIALQPTAGLARTNARSRPTAETCH